MGRKLAGSWRHAERMDNGNRFKCNFCKQVFPGGVVRLRAHLSGITGQGILVCSKVPEDVKSAARLASKKKSKLETASSNSGIASSEICDARCSNEVDSSLAKFFEMNDINCSIVESPSFINLVNMLIKSGSGYGLPSCSTLENQLILSLRKEVEQYVSIARQSWEEIGCTLISEIWCSEKENRSFISIVACSGKRAVLLNTFEIPNNNLTAAFLKEVVHLVVEYVGADKVIQYFVDDTHCSEEIAKFLTSKCPYVFTTKCVVRELQSFFEEVQQEVEWVRATFETAKCLVDAMCKDGDLLALMRKYIVGKELKQYPGYDMLESIFEVREELVKFVQSPEWLASGYDQQENGKKATAIITSEEFWEQGEEVLMALKPLSTILHLDHALDSSFGYMYGLVKVAEEVIANLQTNKRDKYQKLWSIFELKKSQIIHETHKAAAFLNPAYLCNARVREITQMEEGINYIIQKFVATADREAFVEQAMNYRQTLSDPSELFMTIAAKTSTPCQWWNGFGDKFPILKKHAIRILCQPCGSSSYKGSLGAFRANLIKQRESVPELHDLNVRMSLFLMEKCRADNAEKRKRINFEEFGKYKSTNGNSYAALVERRHDEETRPLIITSEELPRPKHLKLRFMTVIATPIFTGQKVEGHQGYPIHVYLVDSATDRVVKEESQSMLRLGIAVFDGDFTNESSADECRTREYFDSNDLCSEIMPLVTGDLQVTLVDGVGILGDFSFNYSSRNTRSGKFRLGIKTVTVDCEGIRIREGISNDFVVEDNEVTMTQHPATCVMHLPKDLATLGIVAPMEGWWGGLEQTFGESSGSPGDWNGPMWNYNQLQRSCRSLTQTAARRVKKKALLWRSRSCNLRLKMKERSLEPLDKEKTECEVFEAAAAGVQLAIRNNVNQQEEDGEKAVLEEIDSLNSISFESPAVTPFGGGVATSGTEPSPRGKTSEVHSPKHLSTPWQFSLTGYEVHEPKGGNTEETCTQYTMAHVDDDEMNSEAVELEGIDCLSSTSALTLFGVRVGSSSGVKPEGETDEFALPTHPSTVLQLSLTGDRVLETQEVQVAGADDVKQQRDDTPQEVEEKQYLGDNYKSELSVKSIDTQCGTGVMLVETSSKISTHHYDVFVSFRGEDTRHTFVNHFYRRMKDAGIVAFVDVHAIQRGEPMKQAINNGMDNSTTCVCVFSRRYASSRWCLDELERMVQKNKDIIPVYWDVTPDDVQLKTSMYTDDLARHETTYNKEQVQQWRKALVNVGKLKGFELESSMSLSDSIRELVCLISSKLEKVYK